MKNLKHYWMPLAVLIGGTAFLAGAWWVNGAEREDAWLYIFCIWLIIYAAYELYTGLKKRGE